MTLPMTWLREFQAKEHRSSLRGQSLHRYRCTDAEFRELAVLLTRTCLQTRTECACFALYGAEWLRRCFDGGLWTWQGLFASLGSRLDRPPYALMEEALHRSWGLGIVSLNGKRRLLGSLLLQGGLPLRAIERDGNALREIFRGLLDDAIATPISVEGLAELAASRASILPKSWQVDAVYQLLAEITETTAELSTQIPKGAEPVEYLDEHVPRWQDRLPLSVTDEVGRALFSFMVSEAHDSAAMRRAPLRVLTGLYELEGSWKLVRRILLPHQLTCRELTLVLGLDEATSLPYRLELYIQNERADQQHVATATLWKQRDDDNLYLIDPRGRSRDLHISGTLGVIAVSGTATFGPAPLDGGEERGPLPWVFRRQRGEEHRWEMVAQGSANLRAEQALVLITETSVPIPSKDGEWEDRGCIEQRQVYHLVGRVRILADGELCRINLGESSDAVADYSLGGSVVGGLGNREPVFRGPPTLRASTSGHRYASLHRGKQEWRRSGESWNRDLSRCLGKIELRHIVDDETMHIRRGLHVLPASFAYVVEPDRSGRVGRLRVSGLTNVVTAELVVDETFTAEKHVLGRDGIEWRIAAVGERVARYAQLRLNWTHAAWSTIELPLPIADARFITVDGRVLADSDNVTLDEAHRVIAEVVGDPGLVRQARLLIKLHDHQLLSRERSQLDAHLPLRAVTGQTDVARLELSRILDELRLRFTASQRPAARIELELDLQGHTRRLRVQRFPYGIRFDQETNEVVVDAPAEHLGALILESFPVDAPRAEPVVHTPAEPGRWVIAPELLLEGSRLALARLDGRVKTSTALLRFRPPKPPEPAEGEAAPEPEPEPISEGPAGDTLSAAAKAPTLQLRAQAFAPVLDRMSDDLRDPDWKLLDDYVRTLGGLHAATFDVFESLITRPKAVVIALLRAPHQHADRIWSALEDLPFAWHLIPVRDWVLGLQAWFDWACQGLGERELPLSRIEQLCEFASPRLPNANLVFDLARSKIDDQSSLAIQHLGLLISAACRGPRVKELELARGDLLRDMAARAEATGDKHYSWPSGPLLTRIAEQAIRLLTPDLQDLLFLDEPGFRIPLLNAPVVAALWTTAPDQLNPPSWRQHVDIDISRRELLFELRRMRAHAPRWYDKCYELTLVDAIGRRRNEIFGDAR